MTEIIVYMIGEAITLGWILIAIGVILLLIEAFNPGFFLAVPGTTLIIIGAVSMIVPDIFSSGWLVVIAVATAIIAAGVSVLIYSRIASSSTKPITMSKDSLIGKKAIVTKDVVSENISGKVLIDNVEWSARTKEGRIEKGKSALVIDSEGVHVVIEEC